MSKPTGLTTLFQEAEPFKIGERTFQFRNLGMVDTFKLLGIVKNAAVFGSNEARLVLQQFNLNEYVLPPTFDAEGVEQAPQTLNLQALTFLLAPLLGIMEVETLVMDFLQDITLEIRRNAEDTGEEKVKVDLRDTEVFPMGAELVLLTQLAEHPSVTSFLAYLKLSKESKAVQKVASYLKKS